MRKPLPIDAATACPRPHVDAYHSRWHHVLGQSVTCTLQRQRLAERHRPAPTASHHHLSRTHICNELLSRRHQQYNRLRDAWLGKQCLLVNMPGAKYGPELTFPVLDRPFPENSFNPTWEPHCPELKPAFAEICVTWELEYHQACLGELVQRIDKALNGIPDHGLPPFDAKEAKRLLEEEEEELIIAAAETPLEGLRKKAKVALSPVMAPQGKMSVAVSWLKDSTKARSVAAAAGVEAAAAADSDSAAAMPRLHASLTA